MMISNGRIGRKERKQNMKNRFDIINGKCVVPRGVTELLDDEFTGCTQIKEIELPDTLESIGCSFWSCTSLKSIRIPAGIKTIPSSAFFGCTSLESVDLPDTLEVIDSQAFEWCCNLKSIRIPASVSSIHSSAFNNCPRLEHIEVDPGNHVYRSVSDTILTADGKTLVLGCNSSVVPDGVLTIGNRSFLGCSGLKHINIPRSVKVIEGFAFYECIGLRRIVIPDSVEYMGEYLFYKCSRLKELVLRCRYSQKEDYPFGGVDSLTDLYLSHGPEENANLAYSLKKGRASTKDITLHVPEGTEKDYKKHTYFKKFKYITTE